MGDKVCCTVERIGDLPFSKKKNITVSAAWLLFRKKKTCMNLHIRWAKIKQQDNKKNKIFDIQHSWLPLMFLSNIVDHPRVL